MCTNGCTQITKKMLKKIFTIAILLVLSLSVFAAKNQSQIRGQIIEEATNEPLSFATISIHNLQDSVITGTTADIDGNFNIQNVVFGEYTVKVSFIVFKTNEQKINITQQITELGKIVMSADNEQLSQSVITEKVPLIEQKLDKLVMNVSERVSTQGSNALDVIRKAPGVSVDMDGNIKLNGNTVAIWIDGRPSHLSGSSLEALLKATEGSSIDKIEIIANPSAKYDAEGSGGIINIKTKKNFINGFNGTITAGYSGMQFDKYLQGYNGSLNLNYRNKKTNSFFTYSARNEEFDIGLYSKLDMGDNSSVKQISETKALLTNSSHTLRLGTDLFANKNNTFGYIITAGLRDEKQSSYDYENDYTDIYLGDVLIQKTKSNITTPSSMDNISGNLNYTHIFNEQKGSEMTANIDYSYFDLNDNSTQINTITYYQPAVSHAEENIVSNSDQFINILSAKVDYQHVFWKTGQIETGVKWAGTRTDNDMVKTSTINPIDITKSTDPETSGFRYTEQIGAAYVSVSKMFSSKFITKFGLRAEYTQSLGDWKTSGTVSNKKYLNLFPTAFVSYNPTEKWRTSISYTRRISRPGFYQLNPFKQYIDANTLMVGNPDLDPQFINQTVLSVGYSQYINAFLYCSYTQDLIMQSPFFNEETGLKKLEWDNFGTQIMYGGGLNLTEVPLTKWLTFTLGGSLLYNINKTDAGTVHEGSYSNNGYFGNLNGSLTALLPKDFKVEFSGFYQSRIPYGYFVIDPMNSFDLGVKKNMIKNKATLSLTIYDIFRSYKSNANMYTNIDGVNQLTYRLEQKYNMQKVKFTFSYRFGQAKAVKKRNVGNQEETSRVGKSSGSIGNN